MLDPVKKLIEDVVVKKIMGKPKGFYVYLLRISIRTSS
jgi:hypothetical protein